MKLTPENYHSREANQVYMSVSQYKDFLKCEAAALAKLSGEYGEEEADCFTVGSYVHAAIEGAQAMADFIAAHPEIIASTGKNKGELKADYQKADIMIQTVLNDPLCRQMLEGEKETIITAELFGTLWKAKIDVLNVEEGRFTDLKTVKSIREKYWVNGRYVSFVEAYGYDIQMAVYSELERIHNDRFDRLEPFIVAVSKEDAPDKAVICFDDLMIASQLEKVQLNIGRVMDVKQGFEEPKRCEQCRYCRKTKKAQIVHYLNLLEVI